MGRERTRMKEGIGRRFSRLAVAAAGATRTAVVLQVGIALTKEEERAAAAAVIMAAAVHSKRTISSMT
jgi:hypothetical protein